MPESQALEAFGNIQLVGREELLGRGLDPQVFPSDSEFHRLLLALLTVLVGYLYSSVLSPWDHLCDIAVSNQILEELSLVLSFLLCCSFNLQGDRSGDSGEDLVKTC